MDKITQLFHKISKKDRDALLAVLKTLGHDPKNTSLRPIKLHGRDFYRIRQGRFRIIYHLEKKLLVIDSVKLRNEKTYK